MVKIKQDTLRRHRRFNKVHRHILVFKARPIVELYKQRVISPVNADIRHHRTLAVVKGVAL